MNFKELREKFNKLNEGYSKNLTDKDVDAQFKKFKDWEGGAKAFFGDLDKARAEIKQDYSPANSARPTVWTALSYPVRDGDYYFAFIGDSMRENAKANAEMNRELRRLKGMKATPEQQAKGFKDVDALFAKMYERFGRLSSLGAHDTMTREELSFAVTHNKTGSCL